MQKDNDDRPSALFSKKQRRRLESNNDGLTPQKRYQMHHRIRKRVRWTVYDFALLYDNWDELNLDKVFDSELHMYKTQDGVSRAVSTLYRGLFGHQLPFEDMLIDGIWRAESDMNNRRVDVRFSVGPPVPGDVYSNNAAERVTPDDVDGLRIPEMRTVLEALAHSDADIPELVAEGRKEMNPHYD